MNHLEIRLSGSGGQGLQLSARILATACMAEGAYVAQSQSYEPTSRGGMSRSDLVVDGHTPDYPLATALDVLLILDECAAGASDALLGPDALVLADADKVNTLPDEKNCRLHVLPLVRTARDLGNIRVANIVALGAMNGLTGLFPAEALENAVRAGAPARFLELNLEALAAGYALAGNGRDAAASAG
jgi:2-oxoglutarate ferredoxin oxidoreductase subunit gamma